VKCFQKMFMFLTEKTQTDVLHILVRCSVGSLQCTYIGSYMSAIMYSPGHH